MHITLLPWDVHSQIWRLLDLGDIIQFRQTNTTFFEAINYDKQLWAHIFEKEVKAKSLCVPSSICSLDNASAKDIESLVKHAVLLEKNYNLPNYKLSVRELRNRRAVTWVKLIRGAWCLAASSDTESSSLLLWDLSDDQAYHTAEYSLPGPVIDGILDDSGEYIRCAVTVGTCSMYISILEIGILNQKPIIRELSRVQGASHVRLLKGPLVGFATKNGDDTYPFVAKWGQQQEYRLFSHSTLSFSPLPQDPSIFMVHWDGFIVSFHGSGVKLHVLPKGDCSADAEQLAFVSLPKKCCLHLAVVVGRQNPAPNQLSLLIAIQYTGSQIGYSTITCTPLEETKLTISEPSCDGSNRDDYIFMPIARYCAGTTGRRLFRTVLPNNGRAFIPRFLTSSTNIPADCSPIVPFSRDGLPFPNLISGLDFDDGWGLIAMGLITGELCIGSFFQGDILTNDSTYTRLPSICISQYEMGSLSECQRKQDIPLFYKVFDNCSSPIHPDIISELTRGWSHPSQYQLQEIPGWSNNWIKFEYLRDWIHPYPRWGVVDKRVISDICTVLTFRDDLETVGEIYPVLYNGSYQTQVVFRIGQRMYICKTVIEGREDEDEIWEVLDKGYTLGVLPFTYDQFLRHPGILLSSAMDWGIIDNLGKQIGTYWFFYQLQLSTRYYLLRDYMRDISHMDISDKSLLKWSDKEWSELWTKCVERRVKKQLTGEA